MSATSKRHQPDGGQSVDDILHRQPGKDDGGDAREHHGDLLVQPALGDHGQAQGDTCRHHHSQQRGIASQCACQRPCETGIHHNHRHDGRRTGQQRNGQRVDGEIVPVSLFFHRIAGSPAAGAFGAFALLALGGQHVQRDKEQDDAAGDLESGLGDVEIAENPGPAQGEEHHNGSGDGGALECGAQLSGAVLRLGHGKEDRRVADRVDHHEIDDKGCDETLEHGLSLHPRGVHCPHQNR